MVEKKVRRSAVCSTHVASTPPLLAVLLACAALRLLIAGTTRMPHPARHSRPHARRQNEAHALGSLLDTLHSPSDLVPPATAHRHSSQPEYTAPPSPLPPSSRIHAASVGLLAEDEEPSRRQRPEQQAPASDRTAAQPHPPPEPSPAAPPAGAITRARCKYTRENVRGKWLELRDRLRVGAPMPLETPSLTIPETALATMMVLVPCSGEDVMKRGPPKYADFAVSVPPRNPFTPTSAHAGGTSQSNISQYNNGCSGSQISGDFAQLNSVHHYYHYPAIAPAAAAPPAATAPAAAPPAASAPTATAPAAAPAAAAPPSSEAQQLALREQLADMKAMFEQGLIPSREIYEDKVRQILGLR